MVRGNLGNNNNP